MAVVMSAAVKAALSLPKVEIVKTLEIVRDLFDADARLYVDVSHLVRQWGVLSGASTIKSDQWEIPSFAPTLANLDNYLTVDHPDSVWVEIGKKPKECWVRLQVKVKGALIRQYIGKIIEPEVQNEEDVDHVILRTVMGADEGLDNGIDKHSGDEQVLVYNDW